MGHRVATRSSPRSIARIRTAGSRSTRAHLDGRRRDAARRVARARRRRRWAIGWRRDHRRGASRVSGPPGRGLLALTLTVGDAMQLDASLGLGDAGDGPSGGDEIIAEEHRAYPDRRVEVYSRSP